MYSTLLTIQSTCKITDFTESRWEKNVVLWYLISSTDTFQIVMTMQFFYERKEGNFRAEYDLETLYYYGHNLLVQQVSPVAKYQDTYWKYLVHGHDTDDDFSIEAHGFRDGEQCGKYISGGDLHPMSL